MAAWFERSGAKVIVGKAGLTELAYREWFVPHGAVYLTTVGYGLGRHVRAQHQARAGRPLAEGARASPRPSGSSRWRGSGRFSWRATRGRSLFALANREINLRIDEVYKTLPPPALGRFGEVLSRKDEVV